MNTSRSFARALAVFALVVLGFTAASCGNDTKTDTVYVAPYGSQIVINPIEKKIKAENGPCYGNYIDQLFTITLLDRKDGEPMNNISMTITLDYADNYSSPVIRTMQLYDINPSTGLASAVTVPFTTTTGDSGTKQVLVKFDISCNWKGSLEVSARSAYANAPITVDETVSIQ